MKNSPENNFWNEVRDRLDNYAEEPADDSWDKIAGAIVTKPQPRFIAWLERRASSAQVSLAGFAVVVALVGSDHAATTENDLTTEAKVEPVEMSILDAPAAAEKIASADVASDALAQEDKSSSRATAEQAHSTRAAATAALTQTGKTTGQQVQHTSRKTSSRVKYVNRKAGQQRDTDSAVGVQQPVGADTGSGDSNQPSSAEASSIAWSVEAQEATDLVVQAQTAKQVTSSAVESVIDTTGQKDANKKKKEQVVVAKDKKEAEKKKAQLHIPMVYFQVGPSLAYNKITPSTNDDVTITDLEDAGVFASERVGVSVEAGFQYRVAPQIEVYGGLSYYHQNQHIRYTVADASSGSMTGNAGDGYVFTPVITKHDLRYTMRNGGVSAGMFYRIKTHLLEHKFGVGLLYQQGFLSAGGEERGYTNKGSKYFQYQLQYRMEAGLNDRMRLYFQPGYTHAFHVDEKLNQPFTIKPYRAGISVGIVYLLNNH